MFRFDEFWSSALFGAVIGGIVVVVLLKLWEKKGAALEKTGVGDKSNKLPTEHDERYR